MSEGELLTRNSILQLSLIFANSNKAELEDEIERLAFEMSSLIADGCSLEDEKEFSSKISRLKIRLAEWLEVIDCAERWKLEVMKQIEEFK